MVDFETTMLPLNDVVVHQRREHSLSPVERTSFAVIRSEVGSYIAYRRRKN